MAPELAEKIVDNIESHKDETPAKGFIKTEYPLSRKDRNAVDPATGLRVSHLATIPNAPYPAEGQGEFSNVQMWGLIVGIPAVLAYFFRPVSFFKTFFVYFIILGIPIAIAYWTLMSRYSTFKLGGPSPSSVHLPGKPLSYYMTIKDDELREKYSHRKIPMQVFHDAYFDGKIDISMDMLELMEQRYDWASFEFTWELFRYVLFNFIPEVIMHSRSQDEEQVQDHYDRGDDFYEWFLGPRMVYTSGVVLDVNRKETLEQLQDNKLALVCKKLELTPDDTLLDIGCGWGTLCAYAGKNYGCDVTGLTLGKNQTKFGNDRLLKNGVEPNQGRILCTDFRDIPRSAKYSKIVSLEMGEHVGVRRYQSFLNHVYSILEDQGTFVYQISGFRPNWRYEDLNWGLFMNKYVFPGADASCALTWHLSHLEAANFEIQSVDVIGVHYAATLWRWYENWLSNKDKVIAKYGTKWYRTWEYFLASSVIASRQGSASLFQITCHKNLNSVHRMEHQPGHTSLFFKPDRKLKTVE